MPRKYVRKTDRETRPPGPLVDAQPAIDHVRALVAKGMVVADIAAASRAATRSMHGFHRGWIVRNGVRRPVRECTQATLDAVLAVEFSPSWTGEGFSPQKFRGAREARGMSRRTLAKLTGLCPETFQYWEEGRTLPTRKSNIEKTLKVLGLEWEDVSGPVEGSPADEFTEEFKPSKLDDLIADYPCCVCGATFRSRMLLATHPHPRKRADV